MNKKDLKTVRNYCNSVTLDSTGRHPSIQYVYRMIKDKKIKGEDIDGVKFVYYKLDVDGISKV